MESDGPFPSTRCDAIKLGDVKSQAPKLSSDSDVSPNEAGHVIKQGTSATDNYAAIFVWR